MPSRVLVHVKSAKLSEQIDVIVDGLAGHPCMVLLPSSQRDSEDFDEIASKFAEQGFYVLRPQPRGMGASSAPPPCMTLLTLALDVARCIEELSRGPAVVVGHAFGHWVARVLDLHYPRHVRGLVVLAGAAKVIPKNMPEVLDVAANTSLADDARLKALQICMFAPGNDPAVWLKGWYPSLAGAFRSAGKTPSKEAWYDTTHAPILDLQGACDPWRPESTRNELKDLLGDKVTVQVIQQASHSMIPEQPDAVVEAILHWVRRLDSMSVPTHQ